jgi:TrkA family protein
VSFLVLGGDQSLVDAIVARLVADGDLVRVLDPNPTRIESIKQQGGFVATGDPTDADLVERAGQGARTAVVVEPVRLTTELLDAFAAARITRIVYAGRDTSNIELISAGSLDHVVLRRRHTPLRRRAEIPSIVAAVVAADDVAGTPRVVIDLSDKEALRRLGGDQTGAPR